jgi:hypothetical protein
MMSDHDRLALLFTPVGVLRMPNADIEFASREEIRDGSSHLNCALYHDRYQRTPDGWKFAEHTYEVRYVDTTPLPGSARFRPRPVINSITSSRNPTPPAGPGSRWPSRHQCKTGLIEPIIVQMSPDPPNRTASSSLSTR